MNTDTIEKRGLKEVLKEHERVVVKFEGEWCMPCKQLQPKLEEALKNYNGRVILHKVDVDQFPVETQEHCIRSVPTIVYFNKGTPTGYDVGIVDRTTIQENIEKYLFG